VKDNLAALQKVMDYYRTRINLELEKNNYDLSAPSVVDISKKLDRFIAQHYLLKKVNDS
jgi:hypothetical protein